MAGDVDADAAVSDNTFTSERLGALDGISYAGHAEPVDFDTLCTTPGVPESFSRLELTFVADGVVVEVVPFQYGEGIDVLPEIPAKKGCSASWPDLDYTYLTASQTLEAEYTPYTSALTDGGELPEILVDGSFSSRAPGLPHHGRGGLDRRRRGVCGHRLHRNGGGPGPGTGGLHVHCRLPGAPASGTTSGC